MDVLLQELYLNISLIFLWSPKSARPHSVAGCSCTGEKFILSTPSYLLPFILLKTSLACLRLKASACISISKRVKKYFKHYFIITNHSFYFICSLR